MDANPTLKAVTKPVAFTVATAEFEVDQVTVLLVAFAGATVAVNCCVPPTNIEAVDGATVTPVTNIGLTVMDDVEVKFPF